jgi:hypothetical protein
MVVGRKPVRKLGESHRRDRDACTRLENLGPGAISCEHCEPFTFAKLRDVLTGNLTNWRIRVRRGSSARWDLLLLGWSYYPVACKYKVSMGDGRWTKLEVPRLQGYNCTTIQARQPYADRLVIPALNSKSGRHFPFILANLLIW